MSQEYTDAALAAFIESLTIRAAEIAFEKGQTGGITQRALHASIGSTLMHLAQAQFLAGALLDEEDNQVVTLGPDHPYITGREEMP